ncbi:MAG TPA: PAS domain-containing protein [Longimicrobium sp.]|nr:PAS domain-containing protein [Longimicrobium sp.]
MSTPPESSLDAFAPAPTRGDAFAPPTVPARPRESLGALSLFPELEPAESEEPPFQLSAWEVLDGMSDAFVFLDHEWRYRYVNPRADDVFRQYGWSGGRVLGRTVWEVFPGFQGGDFERELRRAAHTGRPTECEARDPRFGWWFEFRFHPTQGGVAAYARDVTERKRVEAEQALLAAAGEVLAGTLDAEELLRRVAPLALPLLGSWCFVYLVEPDGTLKTLENASIVPDKADLLRQIGPRFAQSASETHPYVMAARTGEAQVIPRVTEASYARFSRDPGYLDLLRRLAPTTLLSVPLVARGHVLGALSYASDDPARRFGERDVALARELAARAALAVQSARLYGDATEAGAHAESSRALLDSLFRAAPIGLAFVDAEMRYLAVNDAMAAVNGLPAYDHAGRTVREVVPGYADVLEPHLRGVLETGEPVLDWEWSGEVPGSPGETRHWLESFYPVRVEGGPVLGVGVTLAEITAQTRAVQAERAAAARMSRLFSITAALSGALTPEQVARGVVGHGMRDLGAHQGMLALPTADGSRLELVGPQGVPADVLAAWSFIPLDAHVPLADSFRDGRPVMIETAAEYEERYPAISATTRRLGNRACAALPLEIEGRLLGSLAFTFAEEREFDHADRAFLQAIARQCAQALERARLYEAERGARAEAEAANRAKSDFLATMSHELRTPLNAIGGYTELLEMGIHGPVAEPQAEALRRIQRNQRHLLGLINEVLSFARIETGHLALRMESVDVAGALTGVEPLVAPQIAARGLAYRCAGCDAALTVRADHERLQQVLLNLLSNAVKFTEPGGAVSLEAEERSGRVEIRVRDTGIGIPPEQRAEVFEPFVQLDRGLTRTAEGTGLGLAISRDLARAMGGDLAVDENPCGGSVFTLTLQSA